MKEILLIRLTESPTTAQWMLTDAAGARLSGVFEGALVDATTLTPGRQVIVLVPSTCVLLAEPELPPIKNAAKLTQAVSFALEDQLASDIDEHHFAIGKTFAKTGTRVAIVKHEWMQRWQAQLKEAQIEADAFYTEASCIPALPDGTVIIIDHRRVYFRQQLQPAVTLELEPLSEALSFATSSTAATPLPITLYITDTEYQSEQTLLHELHARIGHLQIKLLPDGVLPLLALRAHAQSDINLLQGPYTREISLAKSFAPWRTAAILTLLLLAVHVLAQGVQWWQLNQAEKKLDQAITQLYNQTVPGAAVSAKQARKQFEQRLNAAASSPHSSALLESLVHLSTTLSTATDTQLDGLAYRTKLLDLRLQVPNVAVLDQIRQGVQQAGITAEIQSANPRDNKIEGRLQLKLPGA